MRRAWLIGVLLLTAGCSATAIPSADPQPRTHILNGEALRAVRDSVRAGSGWSAPAVATLIEEADAALSMGPYSVVHKTGTPPSGDPHDYMSIGVYWWPNPDTPDNLPYVRRDGEYTPEALDDTYDKNALVELTHAVPTLALAYYLTDHAPYAEHAALLVRTWFVDPSTRMNPHLEYGQAIPGRNEGRPIGIIETTRMSTIADAIALIEPSSSWSARDAAGVREWYDAYLDWLLESDFGREEANHYNNHGTWYDVQAAHFALFVGREDVARKVVERVPSRRIVSQIEPDGRQPHELARTQSFNYSVMNLLGFMNLARIGEHVGIDLWTYRDAEGRGLRGAVEYLLPYIDGRRDWPYEQITPRDDENTYEMLRRASRAWGDRRFDRETQSLVSFDQSASRITLTFPDIQH